MLVSFTKLNIKSYIDADFVVKGVIVMDDLNLDKELEKQQKELDKAMDDLLQ